MGHRYSRLGQYPGLDWLVIGRHHFDTGVAVWASLTGTGDSTVFVVSPRVAASGEGRARSITSANGSYQAGEGTFRFISSQGTSGRDEIGRIDGLDPDRGTPETAGLVQLATQC